ncbi:CRISPR-associated helicase/endonuclease Cas3 [Leeuwenhoekiella blandensis]|uniref:Predicted helicase n=1 Tax=Leeuwenhoekiella blandensis (strain CECT 7118 / CCUG 51940 / KCTC 22103 / MED217) TaxID=398720 RepID=A3XIA0_LEEBM|nr:CRISPR-associated helicase/endonuclease Cas3 [Leeuwenhoekiella blandensis]EAQ50996.1 predicted helicase [Leeuwenhoekiella blandensis MED217]
MNGLEEIWAKSEPVETLTQHTKKVLEIWFELKERYSDEIENEQFWNTSFNAVAYHDFGKICNLFQETIKKEKIVEFDSRVRHEFFSGMFLYLDNIKFYEQHPESLIAVFSHHKAFNDEGFVQQISENRNKETKLDENVINNFIHFANQIAENYNFSKIEIDTSSKNLINLEYGKLVLFFRKKIYEELSKLNFLTPKSRKNYIYHKAILNISDWTASGHLSLEKGIAYDTDFLAQKIITKIRKDGKNEIANKFQFKTFQQESLTEKNVIAIAPTGSGKTEAALIWASSKKDWERIIYLLPTRVTSNAIYSRLTDYFGEEYTQLIHSSARQYIKEQFDNSYDQKKYFRDKSFFKNINICTIDQLLTLGFNLGFWEVKTFHLLNARIIIDEIHLYSPYTLGLIISTIIYLKENFNTLELLH